MDNHPTTTVRPAATPARRIQVAIATGLGAGYVPYAPGTVGSLWGIPFAWALHATGSPLAYIAISLGVIALGIVVSNAAIQHFQRKDPPHVVIDEIAAFSVVFCATKFDLSSALLGFVWFRFFDILKPWPIRKIEYLPRGWGVMADDLVAGLYAGIALWLSMFAFTLAQ